MARPGGMYLAELSLAEAFVWKLGNLFVTTLLGPLLSLLALLRRSQPNPADRASEAAIQDSRPEVLCVGDSLTAGTVSADWVAALAGAAPGWAAVNAGVNGQVSAAAARGFGELLAAHPRAAAATLLIGSNDVLASLNSRARPMSGSTSEDLHAVSLGAQQRAFAIGANGLRHHAAFTLDAYAENVHALAGALAAAGCRVALVTLPPIGEDLDSAVNARVMHFNEALKHIASMRGLALLDLHAALAERLRQRGRPASRFRPALVPWMIASSLVRHTLLGQSWDGVARAAGRSLLTDDIHLSDTAAAVLAALVAGFLSTVRA